MAAEAGHVEIVKYLVEKGAEVNPMAMVRIDMYNITYRLRVILLYSFQNSVYNDKRTDDLSLYYVCAGFCMVALMVT